MQTLGSVKTDADGKFSIPNDLEPASPYLLQGLYEGVTYNRMIPPGSPSSGLDVQVYDSVTKTPDAKVSQHMVLLEPSATELVVSETVIYENSGKTTFQSPEGTYRFFIPAAVKNPVRVTIQAPQGMPVQRPAEKAKEPNIWVVKAPIKPGETRIDLTYAMPATSPTTFASKILHEGGPVRIVVPKGVTLEGQALKNIGTHPQTQATIYEVTGDQYALNVQGTGSLRASGSQQETSEQPPSGEDSGPGIDAVRPLIYRKLPWVIALGLSMLAIGFVLLYRLEPESPRAATSKKAR
jgi:hypothetical protein